MERAGGNHRAQTWARREQIWRAFCTPAPPLLSVVQESQTPRNEIVVHETMETSGTGAGLSPGCSERWPRSCWLLPPGAAALPPPLGQPLPRPIPPLLWPLLLKVAGCLSAREKRRPSGE